MPTTIGQQRGGAKRLSEAFLVRTSRTQSGMEIGHDAGSVSWFETAATLLFLFYTMGAVAPLVTGGADLTKPTAGLPPSPMALAIKLAVYGIGWIAVAPQWRAVLAGAMRIRWILAPVALAVLSVLWSQDVPLTMRSVAVLLGTTVFAIYFGVRYPVRQQLNLLARVFGFAILLSIVFAVFLPKYGIDHGSTAGDWRGVFLQKNGLGEMMVLAFFVFLFLRLDQHRRLRWVGMAAALALLFLSKSATSIIVGAALLAAIPLYRLFKARFTLLIPICIVGVIVLAVLALAIGSDTAGVLAFFGRQTDLSGRTELWKGVVAAIGKRPWLGYGFSAFWRGMTGPSGIVIEKAGWTANYAHNGFLDLMLQLGIAGLLTYLAGYLWLWRRAIGLLKKRSGAALGWLCTVLLFMVLYNLTEGSILGQDTIGWLLYVSVAVALLAPQAGRTQTENFNER